MEGGGRYIQLRSLGSLFQNREDFCQEPLQARGERPTIASERSIILRDVILRASHLLQKGRDLDRVEVVCLPSAVGTLSRRTLSSIRRSGSKRHGNTRFLSARWSRLTDDW